MTPARILLFVSLFSLGTVAAACGGGPGSSYIPASQADATFSGAVAKTVTIEYMNFSPGTITIHEGQTVEWEWEDYPTPHNVTFSAFGSPTQASGVYYHTFDTAGTFPYRCTLHPDMVGVVTVLP